MRAKEAFKQLLLLWIEDYGDKVVGVAELDQLARKIGKSLLCRYQLRGRPVPSPFYDYLIGHKFTVLDRWRYLIIRRRGQEWWEDTFRLQFTPTDAELRKEKIERFIQAWRRSYEDLPVSTDQLVGLAIEAGFSLGYKGSQRARQVAVARLVRNLRGTVVDGWRIGAPSHCRPTKWRLEKLQETVAPIEAPPIF